MSRLGPYANPKNKDLADALAIIRRAQAEILRESNGFPRSWDLGNAWVILEDADSHLSRRLQPFDYGTADTL